MAKIFSTAYPLLVLLLLAGCETLGFTTPTYVVRTVVNPADGGVVTVEDGDSTYTDSTAIIEEGQEILIEANPNEGWRFTGWTGDIEGTENPTEVSVGGHMKVIASFERVEYPLNVTVEGEGEVREAVVSAGKDYPSGTRVKVTAVPESGWAFREWTGDLTGQANPRELILNEAKSIRAHFERHGYTLTVTSRGNGEVDWTPRREYYDEGEEVTITAEADDGYYLSAWNGIDSSSPLNPLTITMDGNEEVEAVFASYAQGVSSSLYAEDTIGDRVYTAVLELVNNLGGELTLERVILRDGSGEIVAESDDEETIESGETISYTANFTDPPTFSEFSNYVVEWHCEYDDEFVKESTASENAGKTGGGEPEDAIELEVKSSDS